MLQCHVAVVVAVSLLHSQKRSGAQVRFGVLHTCHGGKGVGALVLQEHYQMVRRLLHQAAGLLHRGGSQLFETPFRVSAGVGASADDVQFVLQEQPGRLAKASVGNGAEATSAGVLRFAVVLEVHAHVRSPDVHVANAHAAAVKVAVLEKVHDRLGKDERDVETVSLGDGRHGGRLDGA